MASLAVRIHVRKNKEWSFIVEKFYRATTSLLAILLL